MHWLRAEVHSRINEFLYCKLTLRYWNKSQKNPARELQMSQCTKSQKLWSSGICLMYMRPGLTGKTWKTIIDKLILVITNKDREVCVNGSNTHKDVVSGDTTTDYILLFDQHLTQGMKIGLLSKVTFEKISGLFRIPHPGLSTFQTFRIDHMCFRSWSLRFSNHRLYESKMIAFE